MFYLPDFANGVGKIDKGRVGISSSQNHMHMWRFAGKNRRYLVKVNEMEVEGIVDFIEDEGVAVVRRQHRINESKGILGIFSVFSVGVGIALNAAEPFTGVEEFDERSKAFDRIPFAGIEIAFHELDDGGFQPMAASSQCHA